MMRKLLILLLLCCLTAGTAHASALLDNMQRVETAHPFSVTDALPLPDGGIVLSGQVTYKSTYRPADMAEVDRLTKSVSEDGYAICLNADGTKRWDFYGGMPDYWNNCKVLGLLPDGRVVLSVRHVKELNHRTQLFSYFYIDQAGNVEKDEQLYGKLVNVFDPETLMITSSGLLGGANMMLRKWNAEFPTDATLLDFEGREVWRHNPSDLGDTCWLSMRETDGGYLVFGDDGRSPLEPESASIIRKLDQEGKEVWTFSKNSSGPSGGVFQLTTMPDSNILFRSIYSPDGLKLDQYNYPAYALSMLDKDGNHLWSRYYNDEGYTTIGGAEPLGNSIVLPVTVEFPEHELLLLDKDGNITAKAAYGEPKDAQLGNLPNLVLGADGSVYAYGTLHKKTPPSSMTGGDLVCSFYVRIDESLFE